MHPDDVWGAVGEGWGRNLLLGLSRGNARLADRFTPHHPAIVRQLHRVVEVGREHNLAVSVCGEMASDPLMAFTLVGLGIRQLSVSPISLPRVKALIRGMRVAAAVEAAGAAMDAATADDAETILRAALHAEVDGELLHT